MKANTNSFAKMLAETAANLKAGKISVEDARAMSGTAKEFRCLLQYELSKATAKAKYGEILEIKSIEDHDQPI